MSVFLILVFALADGKRVTLRFMAGNRENDPPPAQPPTPSPACDGDVDSDGALAAFPAAAASAEDVEELWSARKTRFFIAKYSEMKDLVGKTRALRTRRLLWKKLAEAINTEFLCNVTATQVENKWKSLDRAYKKSKKDNNSSGHHRVNCEYEEELAEVLEKEHSVNPRLLLEPGKTILPSASPDTSITEAPQDAAVPVECNTASKVRSSTTPKRKRQSRSQVTPLLEALEKMQASRAKQEEAAVKQLEERKKWEEAKAKRHDERMQRFDRLIDVLSNKDGL
ncbi:uncharacterized protein LOC142804302 [Rhipicephalus microplus]